jgi:hypothetical protein
MTKNQGLNPRLTETHHRAGNQVFGLPPRPASFYCEWNEWVPIPPQCCPTASAESLEFLSMVEWSWSMANERVDAYFLEARGPFWLLWNRFYEDPFLVEWSWTLQAHGPRVDITEREAAVHLVLDSWIVETRDYGLDPFHIITKTGLLSKEDLEAMRKLAWPQRAEEMKR